MWESKVFKQESLLMLQDSAKALIIMGDITLKLKWLNLISR